ncbi:DUF2695 domain-containing protein [Nocardioides sp. Leaf285]|uniref:DUF2695 domain-containing protein n=1 Tax=Nocardioides sp. Leaf285 TaxID=1736322 RepID=UPI000A784ED3|nr:DUF2695 domain-containing protein [Nocardioides sp. Leaf285]
MHDHDTPPLRDRVAVQILDEAAEATWPRPRECSLCFVARMLQAHGCDGSMRWAERFREVRSPTATGLERRLSHRGGGCDCAALAAGWRPARHVMERDLHTDELSAPARWPDCAGVRRTSSRGCGHWERAPR